MKRLTFIFVISFLLIGCIAPKVIISPDTLPDAIVGKPYYAEIEITGGSGPVTASGFNSVITPRILWVEPNYERGSFYNSLTIQGTPETTETITVEISGHMIPSGWSASSDFEKTYVIKVKQADPIKTKDMNTTIY